MKGICFVLLVCDSSFLQREGGCIFFKKGWGGGLSKGVSAKQNMVVCNVWNAAIILTSTRVLSLLSLSLDVLVFTTSLQNNTK